jgi:hypothetical protein
LGCTPMSESMKTDTAFKIQVLHTYTGHIHLLLVFFFSKFMNRRGREEHKHVDGVSMGCIAHQESHKNVRKTGREATGIPGNMSHEVKPQGRTAAVGVFKRPVFKGWVEIGLLGVAGLHL